MFTFELLEVASLFQQRNTVIMRFAVQSGLIGCNPSQDIASAVATAKRQHRAALELNRIPDLLHRIDHYSGRPLTQLAVEHTLLVFISACELRFARRSEVDFETSIRTIPSELESLDDVKHSAWFKDAHTSSLSFIAESLSHFGKDQKHEWESRADFCR
jgi:hypothetical protein